ncbi:PTS sugar transporter subunit IIA [Enterococcus crotali]|uniref:PTS sugar transporter subunit IIA n=1 Tax=Enterococcus crotali TaxID=1453587 RepID=UPI000AA0CC9F|nr:PTS glucose transporter subunit IIA [Enterococcus crotali]
MPLENINDKAFASGTLGQGLAISPTKGEVVSPVNGTVTMAFATGHAVGLTSENGAEVLIHIGLDTVQLDGKHFELKVTQGQTVKAGDPLVVFDIEAIKAAGFDVTTPVIITNTANYEDVVVSDQAQVDTSDRLITLL